MSLYYLIFTYKININWHLLRFTVLSMHYRYIDSYTELNNFFFQQENA